MSSPQTPAPRPVFLSYAREDTEGAKRIAEALRSRGIEVWFDQSELRGGDTWDQKIRRQIKECALFVPVISATTQARGEGYFRREWHEAANRTRDMAAGLTFILPVVIDATRENEALVPDEFMRVQWSHLPGALPTPDFVEHVRQLLETPRRPIASGITTHGAPAAKGPAAPSPSRSGPLIVGLAALAVASAAGLWFWLGRTPPPAVVPVGPPQATVEAAAEAPAVPDKSIAVLPFANMSDDKDTGFFADGVHEDLLTNLATVAELKVISRTSVMQYRGTTKTIRQIGKELGVAYVLEGSVRRAGNQVRVTGQLINTRNDEHLWARSYDRSLTDIFSIQSALAQEIAGALSAAISPETKKLLERRPTDNPAAYDLFLKGRDARNRAPIASPLGLQQSEDFFAAAVKLDPRFAAAWGELAVVHALNVFWGRDASAERQARGEEAVNHAALIAPDDPDVIGSIGTFAYYAHRDYEKAAAQYQRLAQLQPNNPVMHSSLGLIRRRQGHWAEALPEMQKAVELDPRNINVLRNLTDMLQHARRWDEVETMQRRLIALLPAQVREELALANFHFLATGSLKEADALLARLTPVQREEPSALYFRKLWAIDRGDTEEFKRLDRLQPFDAEEEDATQSAANSGTYLWSIGEKAAARERVAPFATEWRHQVETEPGNPIACSNLSFLEFLSGRTDEALKLAAHAMELMPESKDALDGINYVYFRLEICGMAGDKDAVLAGLPGLLSKPSNFTVAFVRADPCFAGLKGDPRWEAILSDPKFQRALF